MNDAIVVEQVTKTYGAGATQTYALRGVDMAVHSGEVLLMEGPSGSGKTTLLSIMGAILRPTSGRVVVGGRDIARLSERELPRVRLEELGFVFQGFNLFPALSAVENVAIALDIRGERGAAATARARKALDAVGLADKAKSLPRDLSGGQKQRVAIARALVGGPRIILADEPTASLDADSGRRVMELLRSLAVQDGRAVVIVTHDARTFEFADRVVRIEDGAVKVRGSEGPKVRAFEGPKVREFTGPRVRGLDGPEVRGFQKSGISEVIQEVIAYEALIADWNRNPDDCRVGVGSSRTRDAADVRIAVGS